jgi:S1-C subfamily serine protease
MPGQWFYKIKGKEYGPVEMAELRVLAEGQMISQSTLLRNEDDDAWLPANKVDGIFEKATESNPRHQRRLRRSGSSSQSAEANSRKRGVVVKPTAAKVEADTETVTRIEIPIAEPKPSPATAKTKPAARPTIKESTTIEEPASLVNVDISNGPAVVSPAAAYHEPQRPTKRARGNQNPIPILIAVGAVVLVGLGGLVIYLVSQREVPIASKDDPSKEDDRDKKDKRPAIDPDEFEDPNKPTNNSVTKLSPREFIKKYEKSVVRIQVVSGKGGGVGSGYVADSGGIVVTNHHVIKDAKSGKAEFNSFHQFATYDIEGVLYFDAGIDIAIIKLKTSKRLPHLDLARQPPEKGEPLMVFGAPDGAPFVANPGSVTAVNMASDLPDKYGTHWKGYWIRTDAKVWHGNSGGPMMSLDSQRVVGVVTWGDPTVPGANFASAAQNIKAALDGAKNATVVPLGSAQLTGRSKWPQ